MKNEDQLAFCAGSLRDFYCQSCNTTLRPCSIRNRQWASTVVDSLATSGRTSPAPINGLGAVFQTPGILLWSYEYKGQMQARRRPRDLVLLLHGTRSTCRGVMNIHSLCLMKSSMKLTIKLSNHHRSTSASSAVGKQDTVVV